MVCYVDVDVVYSRSNHDDETGPVGVRMVTSSYVYRGLTWDQHVTSTRTYYKLDNHQSSQQCHRPPPHHTWPPHGARG